MSSHREMLRLAQDPAAVNRLAAYLRTLDDADWNSWEANFLENLADRTSPEPISMRQREKLLELRDDAKMYSTAGGLSIAKLIRECWLARIDLSEEDEAFIVQLREQSATSLKRRPLLRLLACARQAELIEGYVDIG